MNRALAENLHCLNTAESLAGNGMDMNVLVERQRALMKWQLQDQLQQQRRYLDGNEFSDMVLSEFVTRPVKDDPGSDNGWPDFGQFGGEGSLSIIGSSEFGIGSGFDMNYGLSRTSCPPAPPAAAAIADVAMAETEQRESVLPEKMISKKRKAGKNQNLKAIAEDDSKKKRVKGCPEDGESKITEQSSNKDSKNTSNKNNSKRETSADTSKENSKVTEVEKPDYIHVRARRGQATDSHSLAERVRREKISERMKYLQDLVPGCSKITGKAGMLDEIINYVQSLQRQVEFLSMKLAAANPALDFNIDYFAKEVFPSNFPIGVSSEITNPSYLQFNPIQKLVSCNGLEMGLTAPEIALRRTISAPVSIPETFLDSSCFNHIQSSSAWDTNLQSLYSVEFLQGDQQHFNPNNLQVLMKLAI